MAVSQFLRPGGLLESVQSYLTPGVIQRASSVVGEPESSTRQTMHGAVAGVLSGLTNMASTREGSSNLASMVREGGYGSIMESATQGSLFSGGTATNVSSAGHQLLGKIFGGNVAPAAESVAKAGGVRASSATKIMSLAAPLVMGTLAKRTAAENLDSSGLSRLLLSEKSEIDAASPPGFSRLLGRGPTLVNTGSERVADESRLESPTRVDHYVEAAEEKTGAPKYVEATDERPARRSGMRWLPLLLAALVAIAVVAALRSRLSRPNVSGPASQGIDTARRGLEQITLPGGGNISVAPGSLNYDLAKYLGDPSSQTPRTFVFDNLNFQAGGTQLTPESSSTVDNLATILKAYPHSQVTLVGHTDNSGSPEANQTLSLNRANSVKGMLAGRGVNADRISTQGMGQDHPIASNDTEEGRLRNRRTELVVNAK